MNTRQTATTRGSMARMTKIAATALMVALVTVGIGGAPAEAKRGGHLKVCASTTTKPMCALGSSQWAVCPAGYYLLLDGRTCRVARGHGHSLT